MNTPLRQTAMPARDIIVVGASAGGVEAILELVGGLPPNLPAAILVMVHHPERVPSILPKLLSRRGPLPAARAQDGQPILPGHIYVAPPDHQLTAEGSILCLSHGPGINRVRPAIDPLFRSAAVAFGPRVIGVILSGTLDDGTEGLIEIHKHGGVGIAQDPADARFKSMPESAIRRGHVDYILLSADIAPLLVRLARAT